MCEFLLDSRMQKTTVPIPQLFLIHQYSVHPLKGVEMRCETVVSCNDRATCSGKAYCMEEDALGGGGGGATIGNLKINYGGLGG